MKRGGAQAPKDLLPEEDNLQLRLVNFISRENSKLTQIIYDTNSQFVRTCLVVNWEPEEKEGDRASLVEARTEAREGFLFCCTHSSSYSFTFTAAQHGCELGAPASLACKPKSCCAVQQPAGYALPLP